MASPTVFAALFLIGLYTEVKGHGRLLEPPSRASMWRVGFNTPHNYNDNQLFCGGFSNQQDHGGKCGVCGDPWQGPRDHEAGGMYATGTIARKYMQGQTIPITVDITANHLGWFEFRVCPVNDIKVKASQECLDQNLLPLADGSGTRHTIGSRTGLYDVEVKLPSNLTCSQCVLQWRYHTGNSWGQEAGGRGCLGCGAQEEFYGCSDIAIMSSDSQPPSTGGPDITMTTDPNQSETTTPQQTTPPTCSCDSETADDMVSNSWCSSNCGSGVCKRVLVCA